MIVAWYCSAFELGSQLDLTEVETENDAISKLIQVMTQYTDTITQSVSDELKIELRAASNFLLEDDTDRALQALDYWILNMQERTRENFSFKIT